MPIRPLSANVIAQIAAGEVVERPAAALKELCENAIDAGATRVDCEVDDGGLVLLSVRDNGCGIAAAEMVMAVQPHATSKLVKAEEISAIGSLGFRGEALASIASLGLLTLRSRPPAAPDGMELALSGTWTDEEPRRCVMAPGTEVIVRDLFSLTPARRKFITSARNEWSHCETAFRALAISNPAVEMVLSRSGKVRHHFRRGDFKDRCTAVMGKKFMDLSVSVSVKDGPMQLEGYLQIDEVAGSGRQFQILNGRAINEKTIRQSVIKSCRDVSRVTSFPYVVNLTVDAHAVDVNAHPAKTEVRFREPHAVFKFLYEKITAAINTPVGNNEPVPVSTVIEMSSDGTVVISTEEIPAVLDRPVAIPVVPGKARSRTVARKDSLPAGVEELLRRHTASHHAPALDQEMARPAPSTAAPTLFRGAGDIADNTLHELGQPLAMLHGIYLLTTMSEGLVIIDIHAAHERVLYEEFKELAQRGLGAQGFLMPQELPLNAAQLDALAAHREGFARLGFDIVNDGGVECLHSVPQGMVRHMHDPVAVLVTSLEEIVNQGIPTAYEEFRDEVLARMACHAAVRGAREELPLSEMQDLVKRMEMTVRSGKCNHGRPTWRLLSIEALDRLFERGR